MILQGKSLAERKALTSHYPLMIAGTSGTGKSFSIANLSTEDKQHTVVFNFDRTPISDGENDDDVFAKVYFDYDFEDINMVEKIKQDILTVAAYEKCDRIIIDTLTGFIKLVQQWSQFHFQNFDVFSNSNNAITTIKDLVKTCAITYGKFIYIMAHYPPRPAHGVAATEKRFIPVMGNEHKNGGIELGFNTIIESIIEERKPKFVADSWDESDTTKTRLTEGHFKFVRNSLDDLERLFNKQVKIEDEQIVPV